MKQAMKRSSNAREVVNESTIEVAKAKKDLNILIRLGVWSFRYSLNMFRIHANTILVDDKSEVFQLRSEEFTLLRVRIEFSTAEMLDNELEMLKVFLF